MAPLVRRDGVFSTTPSDIGPGRSPRMRAVLYRAHRARHHPQLEVHELRAMGHLGETSSFSLLVENNQMSEPCSGQSQPPCKGGIRAPISLKCARGDAGNVTVRFNSMRGGLSIFQETLYLKGTNRFYGNATDWPIGQYDCNGLTSAGFQVAYNVFGSGGVACGQNAVLTGNRWPSPTHPTYNFHLASCSVASANLVPTTVAGGYPATRLYAGVARPKGAKLDAGAYEDCS